MIITEAVTHQAGDRIAFFCPGCHSVHEVPINGAPHPQFDGTARWDWNCSRNAPTFRPSIRVFEYLGSEVVRRCHSFVTDGVIEFLGDCTHTLAGQRKVLLPFPNPYGETPDA